MKKLKYLFMMLVLVMAIMVMSGCGDDTKKSERKELDTTVRLGDVIEYIEKSNYSKDMVMLDSIITAVLTYVAEPYSEYVNNQVYTLTELLDTDGRNVIKPIISDTFKFEGDSRGVFQNKSDAFEGITTDDVLILIDNGRVSIYVPSMDKEYDPYEYGHGEQIKY